MRRGNEVGWCDKCTHVYDGDSLDELRVLDKVWTLCRGCLEDLENWLEAQKCSSEN